MTRAESPPGWGALTPVGDEDCNSRRDPPPTNDSPSHAKGAKPRPVNSLDRPRFESCHYCIVKSVDVIKKFKLVVSY